MEHSKEADMQDWNPPVGMKSSAVDVRLSTKQDIDRELIARVAMDIGKSAVSHLRTMYPNAFDAMPRSGRLSLRNHIHNEIMAALEVIDADEIERRLERRSKDRRRTHKIHDAWKD